MRFNMISDNSVMAYYFGPTYTHVQYIRPIQNINTAGKRNGARFTKNIMKNLEKN